MENSIIGGQGVSKGHFPHSFFFGSKWPKNQFQTLKFFSCIGGVSPLRAPHAPLGFIDTYLDDKTMSRLKLRMLHVESIIGPNLTSEEAFPKSHEEIKTKIFNKGRVKKRVIFTSDRTLRSHFLYVCMSVCMYVCHIIKSLD